MPPSREFKIEVNETALAELAADLELKLPVTIHVAGIATAKLHGEWYGPSRTIVLYPGLQMFQLSGLRACQLEITRTLLHELRHAHQDDHWDVERRAKDERRPYAMRECERDAEGWAESSASRFGHLVGLRPKGTRSNLGRLAKAEATVR